MKLYPCNLKLKIHGGRCDCYHMDFACISTYTCEFDSSTRPKVKGIRLYLMQHYVIKYASDLQKVDKI